MLDAFPGYSGGLAVIILKSQTGSQRVLQCAWVEMEMKLDFCNDFRLKA